MPLCLNAWEPEHFEGRERLFLLEFDHFRSNSYLIKIFDEFNFESRILVLH